MGLSEGYQLTCMVFALIQLLYLSWCLYGTVYCRHEINCHNEDSVAVVFWTLILMVFPALMIIGLLKKNLRLLRACKVYNIVEKSAVIFMLLVAGLFVNEAFRSYVRRHYVTNDDRDSVEAFYAIVSFGIVLTAAYMFFKNWLIGGAIESVKQDLANKQGNQYVLTYSEP